jgi:hypothetical protein
MYATEKFESERGRNEVDSTNIYMYIRTLHNTFYMHFISIISKSFCSWSESTNKHIINVERQLWLALFSLMGKCKFTLL